ncbi:hypothetical protein BP5796_12190 [Coleophoma crateriformis]|uniref:Zn(2)-C6 fungal-type domain-containing protein n=1 Tax=Coleophoma crateriformis TaxID=565419 RepID=A0A3D8QBP7_9HELO|nr:hypothetical protein BP5796_12190 [Coleophoma crateriformis]
MASPDSNFGHLPSTTELAPQACQQCNRLKRKCHRELPACSLCIRLGKPCKYPTRRKPYGSGSSSDVDLFSPPASTAVSNVTDNNTATYPPYPFPDAFFLDRELFNSVAHNLLGSVYLVPAQISQLLGTDLTAIYESYFSSIDTWFPFISKKRLIQSIQAAHPIEASGISLVLLCMRLAVDDPQPGLSAARSTLYKTARNHLNNVEEELPTSLHVFQSLILVALYEVGHGIFPAAYLTIGRAARMAILRGAHDRNNATQLFRTPPTWTYWEEERRTWWATMILERYINIGPKGLPLATPEPVHGELLPTSDNEWLRGGIGANQALYVDTFSLDSEIGPFARVCQAAHVLGRLIHHRNGQKDSLNRKFRLDEAHQLNNTLMALDTHLSRAMDVPQDGVPVSTVDVALCTSARFVLYHMYACNEPDVLDERREEESRLQAICIEGLKQAIATRLPSLAWHVMQQGAAFPERSNPLVIQCLYDSAAECQWLLEEGETTIDGTTTTLKLLVEALTFLARRWSVAGNCIPR